MFDQGLDLLQASHPLWLIASMALLPLAGVPVSPLWVLGGMRFGALWGGLIVILTAAFNIAAAYGLAANWLRIPLEKVLAKRGFNIPVLKDGDERSFILLCRVTPGIPLVVQNYLLGCARVRFGRYLLLSLPFVCGYGLAFVLFGDSLADSGLWRILLAAGLVVGIVLAIRLMRKRLALLAWLVPCLVLPSAHAAILVVTNQADAGPGSLREAILESNATPGTNGILFALPGPGPYAIQPATPLPAILQPLTLDAASQPGFSGVPIIELNGATAIGGDGLDIATSDCSVRGLVINRFALAGIRLRSGGNHLIQGNYIGTDPTGTLPQPNGVGIAIDWDSSGNTIGGPAPESRNVISGNRATGLIVNSTNSPGNVLQGNVIGLSADGTAALGNGDYGMLVVDSPRNTIGGFQAGAGNVMSANGRDGLLILGFLSRENVVQGNLIGTDLGGTIALGNRSNGVALALAPNATIGGSQAGAGNLISGNGASGLSLAGSGHVVQGNWIGTDVTGTFSVANGRAVPDQAGILILESSHTIGGAPSGRNVISGNTGHGIYAAPTAGFSVIQANWIGLDAQGARALGNTKDGLHISSASNTLGGKAAGEGNVISGNGQNGLVFAQSTATGNVVEGNFIGTDPDSSRSIPNRQAGLAVLSGAHMNLIGGQDAHAGNVLSGNGGEGLILQGSQNFVQGNWIGTDATGAHPLPNRGDGIGLGLGAAENSVGGSASGEGNRVAFNQGDGIRLGLGADSGNMIFGNSIAHNRGLGLNLLAPVEPDRTVTPNDALDADVGPNRLQNHPVLTNVIHIAGVTTLHGKLSSAPDQTYAIDVYANGSVDPSGFGEGEIFLGSISVDTDINGQVNFTFEAQGEYARSFFTATATDLATGDTSEFSPWIAYPGALVIVSIERIQNGFRIAFTTELQAEYRLERASDAAATVWEPVTGANVVPGTGGIVSATDTDPDPKQRFYRVAKQP